MSATDDEKNIKYSVDSLVQAANRNDSSSSLPDLEIVEEHIDDLDNLVRDDAIRHALSRLASYFNPDETSDLSNEDAYIYAFFVKSALEKENII
jgi:hypothetical protein